MHIDDTTLIAENAKDQQALTPKVKEHSEKMGLQLKIKKTKIMTTGE